MESKIIEKYLEVALQAAAREMASKKIDDIIWKITYRLRGTHGYKKMKSRYEKKAYQSLIAYLRIAIQELNQNE